MGSRRRRFIVLALAVLFVALLVAFPFILPPIAAASTQHEKAKHLFVLVTYTLVLVLELGAMALVAAREIRGIFDDYRAQRHNALNELAKGMDKGQGAP